MTAPEPRRCYSCEEPLLKYEGILLALYPAPGPIVEWQLCRACSDMVKGTVEQLRSWHLAKQGVNA